MNGEMIIHFSNGTKFKGMYRNGKPDGKAIEQDKDGVRFEGSYRNGVRHGEYVMKNRDGQVTETGVYVDGFKEKTKK